MDPQPSSTLVNVAEHAELRLVQLLAESAPPSLLSPSFATDCESRIAEADAPGLIRAVLRDAGAMSSLFSIDPIDEAVSAFSLLAALLDRVGDPAESAALASEVADAVGGGGAGDGRNRGGAYDPRKGVAMLCALYNLRSDGSEKCRLLARIVRLTADTDPDMLEPGTPLGDVLESGNVGRMLGGWGVGREERRELYRAISDGIGGGAAAAGGGGGGGGGGGTAAGKDSAASRRQKFLLLLVGTYSDPAEVDASALASARDAAIGAIRDPVTLFDEQRGMLLMPAVAALGGNPATRPLYDLLRIFQEGKLEDFESFASSPRSSSALAEYGLSVDDCVRHMRLLSLCSLAAERGEVPYGAVATTLRVDDDDVEGWVIAAVSSGLIDAKMDQLRRVVLVERCVVRRFGPEQWRALQGRLNEWKRNVRGVLDGLERSRDAAGQQRMQQRQMQQQQQSAQ